MTTRAGSGPRSTGAKHFTFDISPRAPTVTPMEISPVPTKFSSRVKALFTSRTHTPSPVRAIRTAGSGTRMAREFPLSPRSGSARKDLRIDTMQFEGQDSELMDLNLPLYAAVANKELLGQIESFEQDGDRGDFPMIHLSDTVQGRYQPESGVITIELATTREGERAVLVDIKVEGINVVAIEDVTAWPPRISDETLTRLFDAKVITEDVLRIRNAPPTNV